MAARFLAGALMAVLFLFGCDGGGSGQSDIPPGLNLLESECPGEDIVAIPVWKGYQWVCLNIETGEQAGGPTLDSRSQAGCFQAQSRTDAYCDIVVQGESSFTASYRQFDLRLPPPAGDGCDPDIAFSIEEVECHTVLLCPGGCR